MEYYSVIKQEDILPFGTIWMELEGITLSEISQRERETKTYMSHLYVESWGEKNKFIRYREQTEVGNGVWVQ